MARRKRKCKKSPVEEPVAKKKFVKLSETAVIKRSLKAALKQPYDVSVDLKSQVPESERMFSPLREEIQRIVLEMTKLLKAGSLNIHVSLYDLFQNGTRNAIETEFKQYVNKDFFSDYFRGITMIHGEVEGYKLHETVKRLCLQFEINPPNIVGLGNIVNYACQKYCVNFMNNICTHAYTRIRKFFYAQIRSKKKVYDTLHFLFNSTSEKTPDPTLMEAFIQLRPINFDRHRAGYFDNIQSKWYQYVPLFMSLQG